LHGLGFVHRDLKPENIVLDTERPIKVALIDFDRAIPIANTSHTGTRGTPGYQPDHERWMDGYYMYDVFSLACIAVECDMEKDQFMKVGRESEIKSVMKKHIQDKKTCIHLVELINRCVLEPQGVHDITLDEVAELIKLIKFRPQA
jgi:serine/threonine protein kinase